MTEPAKFNNVVSFLWSIADLLNGAFQKSEFQKIILPFTVLRRLDYALEATKAKVFLYGQDKTARRQRRFGLAQRARRVKNGEGSDPFWTAGTAGTKSRQRGECWSQPHGRKPPKQLNPQTWAIARSDMLILEPEGKDAENIKLGSTLSNDQLSDKRFDFQFVNPPYGYEWSKDFDAVTTEVTMPPLPEQTAIAGVLSDLGMELALLEQRQAKTRALKQGMKHELLTGRTRLV